MTAWRFLPFARGEFVQRRPTMSPGVKAATLRDVPPAPRLRAPHQRPEIIEGRRVAERLQRREDLARPVLVHRLDSAVHEFPLDMRRRERKLQRAAGVIAQALEPAAV